MSDDPFDEPPVSYWEDDVRYGTGWEMIAEIKDLRSKVYAPGRWRCSKCGFVLQQSILNALDGTVTANDKPGETCPNDGAPLWRVTWKEEAEEAMATAERFFDEKMEARDRGGRDMLNHLLALNPAAATALAKLKGEEPTHDQAEGRLPFDVLFWITTIAEQLGIMPAGEKEEQSHG